MPKKTTKKIKITCEGNGLEDFHNLTPLAEGLTELSTSNANKLKQSIIKNGFSFPFFVWTDPYGEDDHLYTLDGHQRQTVLQQMEDDGWIIPEVPVVYIDADNINEAKRKLLFKSSQFGEKTADSLAAFMEDAFTVHDINDFQFPDVDLDALSFRLDDEDTDFDEEVNKLMKDNTDDADEVTEDDNNDEGVKEEIYGDTSKSIRLRLTEAQLDTVDSAVEMMRKITKDDDMTYGDVMYCLCSDYLTRNKSSFRSARVASKEVATKKNKKKVKAN